MMAEPIYYLEIEDGDGLTQVSLVQSPAIEEDFHFFSKEEFVEPRPGEEESEFIGRCIPALLEEGKEQDQAAAICYSYWEKRNFESYSDYPEAAKANAERGIRLNEAIGNKCATLVGKNRAQQIASGEALSEDTIKRTYSYLSRAQEYYNPEDDEACGTISYLLWGGEEMLRWSESKMNQIEKERMAFAIESEERRIITGPAMIAEKPIMRRADDGSLYYVKFSAETIRKAVKLWATQQKYNAVNAEHAKPVGGMYLMESFIIDKQRGINPPDSWSDAPEGSWFLSYYVEDDQVWQDIKDGKFRGFSVEGYFTDKPADPAEETLEAMRSILAKCDNLSLNTLSEMDALSKLKEIKKLLGFSVQEEEVPAVAFAESTLVDGTVVRFPGESLEIGSVLEVQTPEGEYVPAPDGTHETADGLLVTTEGGVITAIDEKDEEEEAMSDEFNALRNEWLSKFGDQESVIKRLVEAVERLTEAQAKTVEVIEQFSAIPSAEPIKAVKPLADKKEESLARFSEALKNLKNKQ